MALVSTTIHADRSTAGKRFVIGDRRLVIAEVAFGARYRTGGEPVTAAQFGLDTQIDTIIPGADIARNAVIEYDHSRSKLVVGVSVDARLLAEVADDADNTGIISRVVVIGK